MTNLNAYQQRGPNIYAQPVPPSMVHQNGPPGVVPTSNPYYPTPGPPPPPHHHIQPQAPMMASGIHGQQQQPYYNTQSPLTDMAVDEEVFTRCTDKNLVNLTPSERAEREETLSRLSAVFEGEKSLGAGTAGMTIAEYSPRRSYSNTLIRQSTDDKSSNSSFVNGADYGSSETTLLNLDDHSNQSKDFGTTPTPTMESSNGGHVFEDIGSIGGNVESEVSATVETPKRGRPRKTPGTTTTKSSKRKESQGDSEVAEDKDDHEKKTEDEDETNEETEKQFEELEQDVQTEREDDAASSEGTNRSETATPEPEADTSVAKKTRAAARRKNTKTVDEEFPASAKKKRGSVTSATAGLGQPDDENSDHKMVTR
ncbi:hypothetical protein CAEBREN_30067 [Caenorhabditis brenneri]|uniref:Uncharacterized protein n=1 Tax=Caenorhabditis brenneri TaxID=135651 RepID=G0P8A2_CAEBE|nr:hypothetical protein CAEBREN_30067 [Caenorhabditis brenneri]